MTTAFILALIAAGGVTVVLIAAINYIRRLERDNARLMRIIGEQNKEIAELAAFAEPRHDIARGSSETWKVGYLHGETNLLASQWDLVSKPELLEETKRRIIRAAAAELEHVIEQNIEFEIHDNQTTDPYSIRGTVSWKLPYFARIGERGDEEKKCGKREELFKDEPFEEIKARGTINRPAMEGKTFVRLKKDYGEDVE